MTITNFNYEGSYLPGLICNIVVKADLGSSAGKSTPLILPFCGQEWQLADLLADPSPMLTSSGQDWQLAVLLADLPPKCIMGYILRDVFHSHFGIFKKRWDFLYFWIIGLVNSQLALYSHVRCNPLNTPQHCSTHPTWQLQISTMRDHKCKV